MKILLATALLLTAQNVQANCVQAGESTPPPSELFPLKAEELEQGQNAFQKLLENAAYLTASTAFGSLSLAAQLGWGISLIAPGAATLGNECLMLGYLCASAAKVMLAQTIKPSFPRKQPLFSKEIPSSQSSWYLNKAHLAQIPATSDEEKKLLHFLENRWLAKATGFFPSVIDWVCPCFNVSLQVHPETISSYARNPSLEPSPIYKKRMQVWKDRLPHPLHFPLILTRPSDVREYLPSRVEVTHSESCCETAKKLALKIGSARTKVVVDLTNVLPITLTHDEWIWAWKEYKAQFENACKEQKIDSDQIIFIQRLQEKEIGGVRLLPLAPPSGMEIEQDHLFLLEWISKFGLSASRVELDRWPFSSYTATEEKILREPLPISCSFSKEEFIAYILAFENTCKTHNPQSALMLSAALKLLKGLLEDLSENKWNEIVHSKTQFGAMQLSFSQIKDELELLKGEVDGAPFFETACHIEQIHASLSALLEIFSPFNLRDFPAIYRDLLSLPRSLKRLTTWGIHASGMTSLAGILKATEKSIGHPPRIIFGENSYFECIQVITRLSKACCTDEATEEEWKEVDLILGQFNPVLKRTELPIREYKVEKIAETLRKALKGREERPLTLALDCTIDFIDSPRVTKLLIEFQEEIEKGLLNVVAYKSGLKFDLFGMDNYSGAPFFMVHNQEAKWAAFDALSNDPLLQADRLSVNWFCLAYKYAAQELEEYRRQTFDNTRALLRKTPEGLLSYRSAGYRVIPIEEGADASFIDIRISGPMHQIRGSTLVGGGLYLKCMESGHPIFYRPSLGFYHPNFTMIFNKDISTIRLTLGLDPGQVNELASCFEMLDTLNGSKEHALLNKIVQSLPLPPFIPQKNLSSF